MKVKCLAMPQQRSKALLPPTSAKPGDLTFAENEDYFARAEQSAATAIIADEPL